jgi:hypothetical protein
MIPVDTIKTRLVTQRPGSLRHYDGMLDCFSKVRSIQFKLYFYSVSLFCCVVIDKRASGGEARRSVVPVPRVAASPACCRSHDWGSVCCI